MSTGLAQCKPQTPVSLPQQTTVDNDRQTPAEERSGLWTLLESLPSQHPAHREVRNDLVAAHMPLVIYLAQRYRDRGESLDDLIQVGSVGLINSVDRFDPARGVAFSTFATPTILGEIRRYFRDKACLVRVPRSLQELRIGLTSAREELSHQLSRSPTVAELATFMELTEEEVLDGLDAANAYCAISLDAPVDGDSTTPRSLEDQLGESDVALELVEMRHCVAPLLDTLSERERRIIFLRFFRDRTQTQIAEELGISQMQVSRLLSQTLGRLREKLAADSCAS
jgi:RNA polymerase sigma-B factor